MNVTDPNDLYILLIRPGTTYLDEQGRLMGNLDVPLCESGQSQIQSLVDDLKETEITAVFSDPGLASTETTNFLVKGRDLRPRFEDDLRNLDYGLWHGKRIDELKDQQPKLFKQWQEHPETVCPPDGETVDDVRDRVSRALGRIQKKHKAGIIAIIAPEPVACLIRDMVTNNEENTSWKISGNCGVCEKIAVNVTTAA